MANTKFHKAQAEALIMEFNKLTATRPVAEKIEHYWLINLAQVHATLALVGEE